VDTDDRFVQLVEALDRDLELLAVLRYRLIVLGALAGADQGPSIPTAVREIEVAYEDLRLADLVRATATVTVAEEFDLGPMPRLDELAARASGAWSDADRTSRPSSRSRAWPAPSRPPWVAGPLWPKRPWPSSG
jgi:predicted Mrr-cat superfamily restriction endonuclease